MPFEGITVTSRILGHSLRRFGTSRSPGITADVATNHVALDPDVNSPRSDEVPSFGAPDNETSPDRAVRFTVKLESDWISSAAVEAADTERRERLRQILTNVRAVETQRALGNEIHTDSRNSLGNTRS